ncbi:MAG: FapA family protein, partial [Desulfobacterales bacterium]|nr:FapA family protein [Desulfobacterales bacterium]
FGIDFKRFMDLHFKITLSRSRAKAVIQVIRANPKLLDLTCIKYYLAWYKISYGTTSDDKISAWLENLRQKQKTEDAPPFLIAHGLDPMYPIDGDVRYHFPTDFLHAGRVNDDGSINFRDRGEIPFVKTNTFLAVKLPASEGKPGVDVTGKEISVQEPLEKTFEAGPGTTLSEDGRKIYAACDGQPHLDARGRISVCPEMTVDGDLGFETGDVIFDGNVVVTGRVKEGFKVKCASLTALEIQGAEVDITGDLNVSLGIVDTELVNVKGSVQAKFIRNSKINAFGDLIVQREIVDSRIRLSGACINTAGSIINSEISANMGIDAGTIGTDSAMPSTLTVGKDEQTLRLVAMLDGDIRVNLETVAELNREIEALEKEDQDLHGQIAQHATVQDRAQLGINQIRTKISGLQAAGNMAAFQKVKLAMAGMEKDAAEAEAAINDGFERQDAIAREISGKRDRITQLHGANTEFTDEKKRLLEYTATKPPKPQVRIARTIRSGTQIIGPNTTYTLHRDDRHCQIAEIARKAEDAGDIIFHEMKTGAY